jgi:hypothetical protein
VRLILKIDKFSLNFIPIALERFSSTFGIQDEEKHFFPYAFNKAANIYAPALPTLPPKEDYYYNSMKPEKRRKFLTWYTTNQQRGFNLREELAVYCMADVRLLSEGLVKFRQLLLDQCGFEGLYNCTTLASVAMTHFRMNILEEFKIGVASELSYENHQKQSSIARMMLKWMAAKDNLNIQHVESPGGEKRLDGNILLDGFLEGGLDGQSPDLAIEING